MISDDCVRTCLCTSASGAPTGLLLLGADFSSEWTCERWEKCTRRVCVCVCTYVPGVSAEGWGGVEGRKTVIVALISVAT